MTNREKRLSLCAATFLVVPPLVYYSAQHLHFANAGGLSGGIGAMALSAAMLYAKRRWPDPKKGWGE